MNRDKPQRSIIFGVCLLIIGALALLDNLNVFFVFDFFDFWPVVFIVFGAMKIQNTRTESGFFIGGALILLGVVMTLSNLDFFNFRFHWWPLFLILGGIALIVNRNDKKDRAGSASTVPLGSTAESRGAQSLGAQSNGAVSLDKGAESKGNGAQNNASKDYASQLDIVAVLSGNTGKNASSDFRGGEITVVMGGVELDLRQANITSEAVINVFVMWGGVELRVPNDWVVINQGSPILGGIEDQTENAANASKRLMIKGVVLMGGLEIKN
jgi:predicted membrane protein